MALNDADCLSLARTIEGAIWWGAFAALAQWRVPHRLGKPNTTRPTDATLVEAARGGLNAKLIEQFANEYQVFRPPLNLTNRRNERLEAVGAAVHGVFREAIDPAPEELARMWWNAIVAVRSAMEPFGRAANLKSFCMKSLWLYHPAQATMWDSFAVRGLNCILRTHHNNNIVSERAARSFLESFEQLFTVRRQLIDEVLLEVKSVTDWQYDYPRRVLDKALWLMGETDDAKAVRIVHLVLDTDPEILAATKQRFGIP